MDYSDTLIASCLYGDNQKYIVGALENFKLSQQLYPNSSFLLYISNDLSPHWCSLLASSPGIELVQLPIHSGPQLMIERFRAGEINEYKYVLFRDMDSRLSMRERLAVDQWMDSNKPFHVMRDHPHHGFPVLGGMWGIMPDSSFMLNQMIDDFLVNTSTIEYGTDMVFLEELWSKHISTDCKEHDEIFLRHPYPSPRVGYEFVGQSYDQYSYPDPQNISTLRHFLISQTIKPYLGTRLSNYISSIYCYLWPFYS